MVSGYKKLRLKFSKMGNAKFISHLDLDRTMKTALTRAGIRVEHTHGFNPRPYLVFSLPASVGTESVCEFLDVNAKEDTDAATVAERLNANLPDDIRITDVYTPENEFKKIKDAGYELRIISPVIDAGFCERVNELFRSPVLVEKRTKKTESGFAEVDIQPYIRSLECTPVRDGEALIETVVSADNATYVNPEYIIKALCKYLNTDLTDPSSCLYTVTRTCVYGQGGEIFR